MVTMNCTDKLAKNLGFDAKADLQQYFELFPEVHSKAKLVYKTEYEKFYGNYTGQLKVLVQESLTAKMWSPDDFSKAHKQVEFEKRNNWQRLIDERPYAIPVDQHTIKLLESRVNKMDFESYDAEMTF